ncbi:hypothetical protein ACQZ4Z_13035 [Agrobacterium vitis]|uniref:hypothetical protein n=1 Tax=Agrobacterium vitis TaxID=373 RepID=UPI00157242C1|nr:hypothetical protein [Agrobacterium vitis]NSZ42839.1 hypothetical protein [Agrobacterium vitis]
MLPDDLGRRRTLFIHWCRNDIYAAEFLMEICEIVRLADDIADEAEHRHRNVEWLLHRALTVLPRNPFFVAHTHALAPLMTQALIRWGQSDEWRAGRDAQRRTFGFVYREDIGGLVSAVAALIGGYAHGRTVADEFFEIAHARSVETVDDWAKEECL